MKKIIFTLCAIAFSSLLVQAQDTPSLDDTTITVKKVEKKAKASYSDSQKVKEDKTKVADKKAAYTGSTDAVNTESARSNTAAKLDYKEGTNNASLTGKTKAAEKNKSVTAKETKNKAKLKGNNDDENNNE
ncbi:MAG: hypothetical protein E2O83_07205 [Bacteroidetes bacterium]|nr:MAG: hypothetical protein E2O83_07205 [Bacteroidota bacterium]